MDPAAKPLPAYDAECTFCPGNLRASGKRNPRYDGVFVFDNDLPCVGDEAAELPPPPAGFYRNRPARGVARVVCYTPRHDLTLAELDVSGIDGLLAAWQEQYRELSARDGVRHVL